MNTSSNAVPQSALDPQAIAPAAASPAHPFYWSVRRELWEYRSIFIAPLATAGVFLFGFLISTAGLPHKMRGLPTLDPQHQRHVIDTPYDFAAGLLMLTQLLVGVFYSLDALHGERRDRSILFWKSLPVSDRTTVLSKASIPLVVLPLFTWAVTAATLTVILLLSAAVLTASGVGAATLWTQVSLFQMSLLLLYHLVTVHSLWHAPFYGWLLLVSGWARRAAFLWALLPPLAIVVVEKIAFNSTHFARMLGYRLAGGPEAAAMRDTFVMNPAMQLTPGRFLVAPGLWIGLSVTAIFLAAAVRLRRYREPM